MASSKTTRDHGEIRRWAEERGAVPAEVSSTGTEEEPGILRLCFPDAVNRSDSNLSEISWESFFEKFDENDLEFVYQEKTAAGEESNFNKLVRGEDSRKKRDSGGKSSSGSRSHAA